MADPRFLRQSSNKRTHPLTKIQIRTPPINSVHANRVFPQPNCFGTWDLRIVWDMGFGVWNSHWAVPLSHGPWSHSLAVPFVRFSPRPEPESSPTVSRCADTGRGKGFAGSGQF